MPHAFTPTSTDIEAYRGPTKPHLSQTSFLQPLTYSPRGRLHVHDAAVALHFAHVAVKMVYRPHGPSEAEVVLVRNYLEELRQRAGSGG